ncbi:MAG: peptidylprolyl isomerase [Bacteroidales bacterium]
MSTIQKLRSKTGLVTIFIGVALLAFVVTGLDPQMFSSITGNDNVIAEINGEKYTYESYYQVLQKSQANSEEDASEIQKQDVYPQAWNTFVARHVYDDLYKEIGLGIHNPWLNIIGISQSEFEDIMIGENIAPEVRNAEIFKNPETNKFDKEVLINTLSNLEQIKNEYPEFYQQWLNFETGMHQKILENKLNTLISKSFYPSNLEIDMQVEEKSENVDFESVGINYTTISDSLVSVSESEISDYYDNHNHEEKFQQEESVTIEYIVFDIKPTQNDIQNTKQYVTDLRNGFINASNLKSFLNVNSDIKFQPKYYKKGELPEKIDEFAFSHQEDSATDVYFESNMYKIAKISDIGYAADSARVRHILLQGDTAMTVADSLKTLLEEENADFTELVRTHSTDSASIPNGGVYDWFKEGQMAQSFQDSSFFGEVGNYYIAPSQFGVHVIEILDQGPKSKQVQVQYLAREVTYSSETRQEAYKEAVYFASENETYEDFNQSIIDNPEISKRTAEKVTPNQRYIQGLTNSRDLIKWAHETKDDAGKISDIFTCGDAFVIGVVTDVYEEGEKPLEVVEDEIIATLRKEKKTEYVAEKIAALPETATLQDIAQEFNQKPISVSNVTFSHQTAEKLGREPKVIAKAAVMDPGQISEPIEGNRGVFIISVTNKNLNASVKPEREKQMLISTRRMTIINSLFEYLKEKAEIEDYRIKFL